MVIVVAMEIGTFARVEMDRLLLRSAGSGRKAIMRASLRNRAELNVSPLALD